MTRSLRSAVLVVAGLLVLLPAPVRAQKLDDEDKDFLNDVRPIILLAEKSTYEKLKDKADRLEFQKIFWARRDPNPATPENDFQQQYLKDRAFVDEGYRLATIPGSATDCGRTFILLGKPDLVQPRPGGAAVASEGGQRIPEVWIYNDRPDRRVQGGKVMIAFDSNCRADGDFAQQFPRMAARRIVHPEIDYKLDKDGHIVKLADQLPRETPTRALLRQPRQDFPLAFQPAYLKMASGGTVLLGLVEGDAAGLAAAAAAGARTVEVSVGASAQSTGGQQAGATEQTAKVTVAANGRFLASFKMGLKPGTYTLRTAALVLEGNKGSVVTTPIEVPDFSQVTVAADGSTKPRLTGTVLVLKDVKEVAPGAPVDAADPFAAFQLNTTRLVPVLASALHKSDAVTFFFQLYDLQLDPATGKANGSVRLKLAKEGGAPLHSSSETPVQTAVFSTGVGPIPLAGFQPGRYVVLVEATDKIGQQTTTAQASFEIQP
jgi:GWxTD domain-containing protein